MAGTQGARTVQLRCASPTPGAVEVSVTDNGPGVAQDQRERIFEAFFTTKRGGMGMGLAISRSIVEAHGGRLWAERNAGAGETFRFSIPLAGVPA
jgi:signal transduction histidine kinase